MINAIFEQFIEAAPITVMMRGIMERIFEPSALNELVDVFQNEDGHAQERSLLPSVLETVEAKQSLKIIPRFTNTKF